MNKLKTVDELELSYIDNLVEQDEEDTLRQYAFIDLDGELMFMFCREDEIWNRKMGYFIFFHRDRMNKSISIDFKNHLNERTCNSNDAKKLKDNLTRRIIGIKFNTTQTGKYVFSGEEGKSWLSPTHSNKDLELAMEETPYIDLINRIFDLSDEKDLKDLREITERISFLEGLG